MTFHLRWIVANAWAQAIGLGTTLILARMAAPVRRNAASWSAPFTDACCREYSRPAG